MTQANNPNTAVYPIEGIERLANQTLTLHQQVQEYQRITEANDRYINQLEEGSKELERAAEGLLRDKEFYERVLSEIELLVNTTGIDEGQPLRKRIALLIEDRHTLQNEVARLKQQLASPHPVGVPLKLQGGKIGIAQHDPHYGQRDVEYEAHVAGNRKAGLPDEAGLPEASKRKHPCPKCRESITTGYESRHERYCKGNKA